MSDIRLIRVMVGEALARNRPAVERLNRKHDRVMVNLDAAWRRRSRRGMRKWFNRGMKLAGRHWKLILTS